MGLISVETLQQIRVLAEGRKEDLRRRESARSGLRFGAFLEALGVLDVGELTEAQALACVAARNLLPAIDVLQIPQGTTPGPENRTYDLKRPKTSLGPGMLQFLSPVPSEDRDLDTLTDPEDIPLAVMEDLLLRRRAPKEFLRRLTEGELLRLGWLENQPEVAEIELEESGAGAEEGKTGAAEEMGNFGYLLLDASESMGTERDARNIVGRGLALAFLYSERAAGNPARIYLFRQELEEARQGREAYAAALQHPHQGMTNLQDALAEVARRLQQTQGRSDVVLVTDGITRLTENPLKGAHLHTFLVGEKGDEADRITREQFEASRKTLQDWSDLYARIDGQALEDLLAPRTADLLDLKSVLDSVPAELDSARTPQKAARIAQRVANIGAMFRRLPASVDLLDFEESLRRAVARCSEIDLPKIASERLDTLRPDDRAKVLALESWELRSLLGGRQDPLEIGGIRGGHVAIPVWEALMQLLRTLFRRWRREP